MLNCLKDVSASTVKCRIDEFVYGHEDENAKAGFFSALQFESPALVSLVKVDRLVS